MKTVYLDEFKAIILNARNGVYARCEVRIDDMETGLTEERTVNIFLTDNIMMPWSELEILKSDKLGEYREQLEAAE